MVQSQKRVVIIGPESTGKSTLSRQLAEYFSTSWAGEYARTYLETLGRAYELQDLAIIAQGQLLAEERAAEQAQNGVFFLDTDLHVIKVWSESKYGTCDEEILKQIAERRYDLYILTHIDMPWEEDPLREHPEPEARQYFFDTYHDIVQQAGTPFIVACGNAEERLKTAIAAVQQLLG